jgi:hypothetical protein
MIEQSGEDGPKKPSAEAYARAAALGASNTPPPGTPKRLYFFAAAPEGKVDAAGVAEHLSELGEILDASKERPHEAGPAPDDA